MALSPKLMARLAVRKSIGLYVGDRELTLCHAALTPLGPVEFGAESVPYDAEKLPKAVEDLLSPYRERRGNVRIAVGLPAMRVFFSTRPIQVTDRDASPAVLLHEVLRSSDVNVDEMQVDVTRCQPGKRTLASLVACRRKYISGLLDALSALSIRPFRVEPAPFALLRLGALRLKAPRRAQAVTRVFLGPHQAVALLIQAGSPLAWRVFELPEGGEAAAVLSTAMALQVVSRHCGESGAPDAVFIHGRPDLAETFRAQAFAEQIGGPVLLSPGPSYDGRSIALGLALGCREGEQALDLSRTMKARPPVREVLPLGQIVAQVAVLGGLTVMVDAHHADLLQSYRMVRDECAAHPWMVKVKDEALTKEKAALGQKVTAVREFLETRVLWSAYTRDAASRLSDTMVLRTFAGFGQLKDPVAGANAKKSLVLGITAPIVQGDSMPREIDGYIDELRSDQVLRRDFPVVELAGLKWANSQLGGSAPQASFTVNCLPRPQQKGGKAGPPPAPDKAAK